MVNNACNKKTTSRKKHNAERKILTKRVDEDMVSLAWAFVVLHSRQSPKAYILRQRCSGGRFPLPPVLAAPG